jgi:holo-[acyl-carrier protein] synthase
MIVGIGVDVVDLPRFEQTLQRTPLIVDRLFTAHERFRADGSERSSASLAVRFAAKEAVAKALGAPGGMAWHDCEVQTMASGQPVLTISGTVLAAAKRLGITRWHVSLSHDGAVGFATVVAESDS